jgi:hypothetical protein
MAMRWSWLAFSAASAAAKARGRRGRRGWFCQRFVQRIQFDLKAGQQGGAFVVGGAVGQPLLAFGLTRLIETRRAGAPVFFPFFAWHLAAAEGGIEVGQQATQRQCDFDALVFQRLVFGAGLRQRGAAAAATVCRRVCSAAARS